MNLTLFPILAVGLISGCVSPRAIVSSEPSGTPDNRDMLNAFSPKLTGLLAEHPAAKKALSNAFSIAFARKNVWLYYFYTNDETEARAFHFYRGENLVNIAVRENQHPWDEYVSILFETVNSMNEKSFSKLSRDAESGKIPRSDFPLKALEIEHRAVKQTRDLIKALGLSEADVAGSEIYHSFLESPDSFDAFLAYIKKVSTVRNPIVEYQKQYDKNVAP
jgi:hypothetical protein